MICPLIRGIGCTVPLCAMRINPSFGKARLPSAAPALAWRVTAWTRNVPLDDIPDLGFRLLFLAFGGGGKCGKYRTVGDFAAGWSGSGEGNGQNEANLGEAVWGVGVKRDAGSSLGLELLEVLEGPGGRRGGCIPCATGVGRRLCRGWRRSDRAGTWVSG